MCSLFHKYRDRGWEFFHEGKFEEAIAEWRVAADLDPEDGYVLSSIGQALLKQGKKEEAIAEWRQAVRLEPDYDKPRVRLAYALSADGYSPEALAAVQAALRLKSDDVNLYNYLGYHMMAQAEKTNSRADWEKAVEPLRQSVALDPTDPYAGQHLAKIQWFLGKKREAIATLKAAVVVDPNNIKAHIQLSSYQLYTGRLSSAVRTYRVAIGLLDTEEGKQHLADSERLMRNVEIGLYIGAGLAAVFAGVWIWKRRRRDM